MIFSQAGFGASVITVTLAGLLALIGKVTAPEAHITVHDLSYRDDPFPAVVQDRTVYSSGKLVASWKAQVQVLDELEWVPICSGSGFWEYDGGHKVFPIPFDEWVGDKGCFLKAATYDNVRVCAIYEWGDVGRERKCSAPFKI